MKEPHKKQYDIIIIGSGHNGLTCACYLAKEGLSVLVLEQDSQIGGMTRTEEILLPGFKSDIHASGYQIANLSPATTELKLTHYGLKLIKPDPSCSAVFPDGKIISIKRDLKLTMESIAHISKHDSLVWEKIYKDYLMNKPALINTLFSPPQASLMFHQNTEHALETQTVRDWTNQHFQSEAMKVFMSAFPLYVGLAPDDLGSAKAAHLFACVMQDGGNNVVQGGMQELAQSLANCFIDHGGEIRLNAKVSRIHIQNNHAVHVELNTGETIGISKAVVSNTDPNTLINTLLGQDVLDHKIITDIKKYAWGDSVLTLFIALTKPLIYQAGIDAGHAANVLLVPPSIHQLTSMSNEVRSGFLPKHPLIVIWNDSNNDPSRVPKGQHLIRINVFHVPYQIQGATFANLTPHLSWPNIKTTYANHIIDLLTTHYTPNLKKDMIKQLVHSPIDIENHMSTAVHGTICHGAVSPHQTGAMRPLPQLSNYKTPIPNVYLCGAGTHPGPGVNMASGRNVATLIAKA